MTEDLTTYSDQQEKNLVGKKNGQTIQMDSSQKKILKWPVNVRICCISPIISEIKLRHNIVS